MMMPIIDITPSKPGLQPLDLILIGALGTFVSPASAGTFAAARFVGGIGGSITVDAITNIPAGCLFRVGAQVCCDALEAEANLARVIVDILDNAGTKTFAQWSGNVTANSGIWAMESPLLRAPELLKFHLLSGAVALRTFTASYWIQLYETQDNR